jgi:acyl-CoA synthetase (AMP-forming)/AMP-acid ligase II
MDGIWSGDIVTRDATRDFSGWWTVCKEMIKYKGFPVAPAEVEAVLLEHPAVRECGVVGRADAEAGEIPVAFIALRDGYVNCKKMEDELRAFRCRTADALQTAARSTFCGRGAEDSIRKNSAARVKTVRSVANRLSFVRPRADCGHPYPLILGGIQEVTRN